ncbi:MAG: TolC family protein, partial [Bryobacteraceae bacterium]
MNKLSATAILLSLASPARNLVAQGPSFSGMSLREAVSYALEHSPELKSSQAAAVRRQGMVTTAHSLLLPQIDLSGDAARTRYEHGYPAGTVPSLLRFDTALYAGSAELKLLVWDFHKTELELAAAQERVETARTAVDRKRQEIVFETARLYLQTL